MWMSTSQNPALVYTIPSAAGTLIEVPTHDNMGMVDGTALYTIRYAHPPAPQGLVVMPSFNGSSNPFQAATLERLFNAPPGVPAAAVSSGP